MRDGPHLHRSAQPSIGTFERRRTLRSVDSGKRVELET